MIKLESREHIDILRIQHGKVNALDLELFEDLLSSLQKAEVSPNKAVVLTGSGSCFSAGIDLFRILNDGKAYLDNFLPKLSETLRSVFIFPKPIVAAINGHAIAGGCILAWACDYKIMAADSGKIGVTELAVGIPFPAMPLEIVRNAVPTHYFQEVVFGAETYTPEVALAMGLLDAVTPQENLLKKATDIAKKYGSIPAESFRLTKLGMRQPILNVVEVISGSATSEIDEFWQSPHAMAAIKNYVKTAMGKKG